VSNGYVYDDGFGDEEGEGGGSNQKYDEEFDGFGGAAAPYDPNLAGTYVSIADGSDEWA
jgi:hypothetical protein